eukprot:CAMPEP_0201539166 /NCGR_PEP_ID=MMETSP0161_2-20130828/69649_1 /ASSEMBLY_ACC=CAM_ASM_000251 /TAXON_ID=180227 /ORGANISM="Neoparamoeba aestuarina, Strain SoJaBio B1-5/56/2" /LENGTH=233 /DNA_ID=CAMNT_0047946385 /DNA_START=452 /DNA_END=1150 /DNA_ORIENTATION=+
MTIATDHEKCCSMLNRVQIAVRSQTSIDVAENFFAILSDKGTENVLHHEVRLEQQFGELRDLPCEQEKSYVDQPIGNLHGDLLTHQEPSSQTMESVQPEKHFYETPPIGASTLQFVEQSVSAIAIDGAKAPNSSRSSSLSHTEATSPTRVYQAVPPFKNIAPQSTEHEIIENFTILLNEVTDTRRKECIKKSLDTLFQLLNERSLEDGLIQKLYRFTQTPKSPEGKELIRVMG